MDVPNLFVAHGNIQGCVKPIKESVEENISNVWIVSSLDQHWIVCIFKS